MIVKIVVHLSVAVFDLSGVGGLTFHCKKTTSPLELVWGDQLWPPKRVPRATGQNVGYKKVNCVPTFNADDAVLFAQDSGRWQAELKHFDDTANTMGLHTSWEKTKLQNTGYGPPPQSVSVDGHPVEVTGSSTWAALSTPLDTPALIFFDESASHHRWWVSWTEFGARISWALLLNWGFILHVFWQ